MLTLRSLRDSLLELPESVLDLPLYVRVEYDDHFLLEPFLSLYNEDEPHNIHNPLAVVKKDLP